MTSHLLDLDSLFHRSKERILELGEVFTPEKFVGDMLDLVSKGKKNFWSNEHLSFFEPTCGHGNIVCLIFLRRLEGFYKKAVSKKIKSPHLYAIANSINTLWAMDIDAKNIEHCRLRLMQLTLQFLKDKTGISSEYKLLKDNQTFFIHFFCALIWQIQENEMISSLSQHKHSSKTKIGEKWVQENGHNPINFNITWVTHYNTCEANGIKPLEYRRSEKLISLMLSGNIEEYPGFEFAKCIIPDSHWDSSLDPKNFVIAA